MAEILHLSKGGIQGPMMNAPPAQHVLFSPREHTFTPAWLPSSPDPQAPFAVDAGIRHKQAEQYVGASAVAAAALGDDLIGRGRHRTPSDPAAPYQKAAAQRSAERAIRPWDPVSGAGVRQGAVQLQVPGSNAGVGAFAAPDAPALFMPPAPSVVAAVATAAGRVARGGQDQAAAEGAVSLRAGAPARELWAVELFQKPPKYCTACRGGHEVSKVGNPEWQPYSPGARLRNLQMLDTKFQRAMRKGLLCCKMSESLWNPIRWTVQPAVMSGEQFRQQLEFAFDGVREGHEPFRFLASRSAEVLLEVAATRWSVIVEAAPQLVAPIKLCLNTMQPQLVGGMLLLLIRLLRCHPSVPAALGPLSRHLLPSLAVFRSHRRPMELPAPVCLPPFGSFSGSGAPHGSVSRTCRVCSAPVYREYEKAAAREAAAAGPLVWGAPETAAAAAAAGAAAAAPAALPRGTADPSRTAISRLPGRMCRRYTLESLVEEVLVLLAGGGGEVARRVIRSYVPSFDYYTPLDQPACPTVEELMEAAAARSQTPRRRPGSAPRGRVESSAAAAAQPRPATAGGKGRKAAKARSQQPSRRRNDDGKDGAGGAAPPWSSSVVTAAELARWDGVEVRDMPYGQENHAPAVQRRAYDPVAMDGGGSGAAALRISTPVPIFDSPHDPLYRMLLEAQYDKPGKAVGAWMTPDSMAAPSPGRGGRQSSARRGGSGGGGPRVNVNAEVPYKVSPAGLRQAM